MKKGKQNRNNNIIVSRGFRIFNSIFCIIIFFIVAYPLYYVIIASFSDPMAVSAGKVALFPQGFTLKGYEMVMDESDLWIGYRNTIFYTVFGTFINILVTFPAAYAVSRKEFMPRRVVMLMFVFTMFFNGGLIPTYMLMRKLSLINNIWVFLIPFSLNVYNFIIVRTFFETGIPEELYDAAQIDGCNHAGYFIRIAMPLSRAIIAVIGLYYAVAHWNDYFTGVMYINNADLQPIQTFLYRIVASASASKAVVSLPAGISAQQVSSQSVRLATMVVTTFPIVCVYPFLQKYFVKGMLIGSIKG